MCSNLKEGLKSPQPEGYRNPDVTLRYDPEGPVKMGLAGLCCFSARACNTKNTPMLTNPLRRRRLLEALFFLFVALAVTWPLAREAQDHLPLGTEPAATVPLFNVWSIWWNVDRAVQGYTSFWDGPIFYPAEKTFAYSEPQPLSVVAAPILLFGDNRILSYNVLLLLALWLNGWMACALLRCFHLHPLLPWLGGAMIAMLPLVYSWLGVLQLVPVFGILLSLMALYRLSRRPTMGRGIVLGLALAMTYLLCAYYGLFLLLILLAPGSWLLLPRLAGKKTWFALLAGATVFGMLCLPFITVQYSALAEISPEYPVSYLAQFSAHPADYLHAPGRHFLEGVFTATEQSHLGFGLHPGYLKTILAAIGVLAGLLFVRRRWTIFCLAMAVVALLLSFGPRLQVGGWAPYLFLLDTIPGLSQARNVFRFAMFFHLMITLLAVLGLQAVMVASRRLPGGLEVRKWYRFGVVVIGLAALLEIVPVSQAFYRPPDSALQQDWVNWLETYTPERGVIVCLPFALKPDVVSYEQEALWMYWQTFHRRPMLNGYSGFFPRHFHDLKWPMAEFPASGSVDLLQDYSVNHVVVRADSMQGAYVRQRYRQDQRIELVLQDRMAGIDIYRLHSLSIPDSSNAIR